MALKTKFSPLQHLSLDNLYASFLGLAPKEKIVALGAVGLLLLILLFLPFSLVSGKLGSMREEIRKNQVGLQEVMGKIADFKKSRAELQEIERRLSMGGSVIGRVDAAAKKVGLTLGQLKGRGAPQTEDFLEVNTADVQIQGANLSQLLDFFEEIEGDRTSPMRIRRITVKPRRNNRQLLDVSCEIATFSLRKEG